MARASSSASTFVTVRSEGGLLPPDLLARIAQSDRELSGLRPEDYGLPRGERLSEATSRAWTNVRAYWAAFQAISGSLRPGESGVTETREQWILPLFRELGYERLSFRNSAEEIGGQRYAISHRAGEGAGPEAPPVHVISFRYDLDRAIAAGAGSGGTGQLSPLRVSPHGLMQDYLNRTDHLWGVVTNGRRLRLLRDNLNLSRAAFVEFDLETMLEEGIYADFVLLYLLLHRTRLASAIMAPAQSWLERWRGDAVTRGARALDALRDGVEAAIKALGQGLLEHPANEPLRAKLRDGSLDGPEYYRQLLRLVYRLLFLLTTEERDLLFSQDIGAQPREIYLEHYSVSRLRDLVMRRRAADRHDDLWRSLAVTFAALCDQQGSGEILGLVPIGGLFSRRSCPDLDGALVTNERLLVAIRGLTFARDRETGLTRRVNYRDMDVEELGSVYEGLLELQPILRTAGEYPTFDLGSSSERKSTGSYYTNAGLVRELVASALEPIIAAALARGETLEDQIEQLLSLKICDPACGSGHFLLGAARRIGREVARLRMEETEPDPHAIRAATREVIGKCIFGVDVNPLAVDLCKLALWIEAQQGGRPLGFLDWHIRCGNSLVGATRTLMNDGIPDGAFEPVAGDNKSFAAGIKRDNKKERTGQMALAWQAAAQPDEAARRRYFAELDAAEDSLAAVQHKEEIYEKHEQSAESRQARLGADLWTAAFFWPLRNDAPQPPTTARWQRLANDARLVDAAFDEAGIRDVPLQHLSDDLLTVRYARKLADQVGFFHWELSFPEVFGVDNPGFDCILGNPPWEKLQTEEIQFFAVRDPAIASLVGAQRKAAILRLQESGSALAQAWEEQRHADGAANNFIRYSGAFPLTGKGKFNTFALFAELNRRLTSSQGRVGCIVPTGIATDDTTKHFFRDLIDSHSLISLYDFENREGLFPDVDSRMKFSLLTVRGSGLSAAPFDAAFFLTRPDQLRDSARRFTLDARDIALLNPNTRTCPIFRTRRDAELTKAIYHRVPIFLLEGDPAASPYQPRVWRLINTTDDSARFIRLEESQDRADIVPVIEAKMIHQFDHRYATFTVNPGRSEEAGQVSDKQKADPAFEVAPRYFITDQYFRERLPSELGDKQWFLTVRNITNATNERTVIAAVIPRGAGAEHTPYIEVTGGVNTALFLAGVLNCLVLDYVARQKIGGTQLSYFILYQLPLLAPTGLPESVTRLVTDRVFELTYTSYRLRGIAKEYGYDGLPFVWDEEQRAQLRADLDGIYAHLFGLGRDDFAYILDTFPIVRRNDEKRWDEYRTKRLCLEAYDRFGPLVAAARATESVPAREAVTIPQVDSITVSTPPALPQSEPHAAPLVSMPTDVVVEVPSLPGLVSPRVTGADRYTQAAALAVVASRGRGDFNFGRLKLVKELYFIQEHLGLDLRLDFVREAHGPLDPAVYKVESLAEKQGWLRVYGKRGERASYQAGPKIGGALQQIQKRLGPRMREVEELLVRFRSFDTRRIEQWATLHQVWHDRRAQGQPLTSGAIVAEVRAWKPDRPGFAEGALRHELDEMVRAGLISLDQ